MKRTILYFLFACFMVLVSCSKDNGPMASSSVKELQVESFDLITMAPMFKVAGFTEISAVVTPPIIGLKYEWKATEGVLVGSGQSVRFTICHQTTVEITCKISDDSGASMTKSIKVTAADMP